MDTYFGVVVWRLLIDTFQGRSSWGQLKKGKITYAKDLERGLWAFVGV